MNLKIGNIVVFNLLFFILSCSTIKVPPVGVNYESPVRRSNNVAFHYDLNYVDKDGNIRYDRNLWEATYKIVDEAQDYLIIEMFLFNDLYDKSIENFPEFAKEYTERLVKKKQENPNLKVYVLLDENNNFYGAFEHPFITQMKEAGIDIIMVDIMKLKDTFPWYSPIWRTVIEPLGNPTDKGWITNFYGEMWPKLTLRQIFRALNVKADHKKVFLNENEVVVSSANIHDPSYYHENIAISADGPIVKDVLDNLIKVAQFSNENIDIENDLTDINNEKEEGEYQIQYLSENAIGTNLTKDIQELEEGEELLMGMYFLADQEIIKEIIKAANRGVNIKIVLDRSRDAFGMDTNGLPNKPVSKKLKRRTNDKIEIKWYFTNNEQYHTKITMLKKNDGNAIIYAGSANLIKKNIRGYIMDSNFKIIANENTKLYSDINSYFDKIWYNKDGIYTLYYEDEVTTSKLMDIMFEILNVTQLGAF